jgi:CTP synthase
MITVGIMGDFNPDKLTQSLLNQALDHAAAAIGSAVEITWIPTLSLKSVRDTKKLGEYNGLIMAPGGDYRSEEGALSGIRFARENDRTFLGI